MGSDYTDESFVLHPLPLLPAYFSLCPGTYPPPLPLELTNKLTLVSPST